MACAEAGRIANMTAYYVRPDGSDGNSGTGYLSSQAWLTLGKALGAAGIASGDTLHVSRGIFRGATTVNMTSATADTVVRADFDGKMFPDIGAGPTFLTSFATDEKSGPGTTSVLNLNGRDFLTFENFAIIGANATYQCVTADTTTSINITFRNCRFFAGATGNLLLRAQGAFNVPLNWLIEECTFIGSNNVGGISVRGGSSAGGADYDINFIVRNCLFMGAHNGTGVLFDTASGSAFRSYGVKVVGCYFNGYNIGCSASNVGTTNGMTVEACLFSGSATGLSASAAGTMLVEQQNILYALTPRTNVTAGSGTQVSGPGHPYTMLIEADIWAMIGARMKHFFAPMVDASIPIISPMLGFTTSSLLPATDMLRKPRPAGGQSLSKAVGAFERHDTAVKETTVTNGAYPVQKIVGPGDQEFRINVDASSHTISIDMQYDTNHGTTTKPQFILVANDSIGVSAQTVTMTVGTNTWETVSFSAFTPTAKGVVVIRLVNRASAANGITYYSHYTVV
jgi:hypothetical protein